MSYQEFERTEPPKSAADHLDWALQNMQQARTLIGRDLGMCVLFVAGVHQGDGICFGPFRSPADAFEWAETIGFKGPLDARRLESPAITPGLRNRHRLDIVG